MTLTTKDVLTQYLMGNQEASENATLIRIKPTCDQIATRLRTTFNTFDFIQLLNRDELLDCFLNQLTLDSLHWHVIFSILSFAKVMYEACVMHEQGFRIHEIINKILSSMVKNDIVQWIENSGGWEQNIC